MSAQDGTFLKIDDDLRLVIGWASVSKINDQDVVDSHNDVIPAQEITKAAMDFMSASRQGGVMHFRDENDRVIKVGEVVFAMPFTADVKKAFSIVGMDKEGLAIGIRVDDDGIWDMVKSGKLAAFSIGGKAVRRPIT